MKKTFYPQPGPLRALADAWQCRRTVRAWQRRQRRAGRRGRLAARLRAWPYWHATGQLLYAVGFFIEYQVIRAGRWLLWLLGLLLRGLAWWLLMASSSTTALFEKRSRLGVNTPSRSKKPRASPRNWSAMTTKRFGRSLSAGCPYPQRGIVASPRVTILARFIFSVNFYGLDIQSVFTNIRDIPVLRL